MTQIVLGIDPGSRITGYGIVCMQGSVLSYLGSGCINAGSGGDTKNSLAEERAVSIGKRTAGANEDILKFYRR